MEQRIKGTTGLMALIGSPVGHSGSPAMYNFSFRYHNLDYAYMAFDIKEDQVPAALDAIRLFKMRGANVTMPCKNEVAKHMDELSPAARIIGAVNTIVNEDGKLVGHITDGIGFVRNLKEHGVDVKGKKNGSSRCRRCCNSNPGTVCIRRSRIYFYLQSERPILCTCRVHSRETEQRNTGL